MAFIGSIQVVYMDGTRDTVRPSLADEIEWNKITQKTLQQYTEMSVYDLSLLVHAYYVRIGQTDKSLLEWSKDIDAVIPLGDHPKAIKPAQ